GNEEVFATVTTGPDGRFTVTGTGNERAVALRFRGAGIAEVEAWVVHRAKFDPKPYSQARTDRFAAVFGFGQKWILHGPELSIVAEPEKPIRGVVKDRDTGAPRPGARGTLSRAGDAL